MTGRECYHCKQWIAPGEPHDCWTTTEAALTRDLPEDLHEAWERLREAAASLGEQRIYASHHSIMFSRHVCYFFVRPKTKYLEACVFLGRRLAAPLVHQSLASSTAKVANILRIRHRDEVEAPLTDWLREAYEFSLAPRGAKNAAGRPRSQSAGKSKRKLRITSKRKRR